MNLNINQVPSTHYVHQRVVVIGFEDAKGARRCFWVDAATVASEGRDGVMQERREITDLYQALGGGAAVDQLTTVIDPFTAINVGLATPEELNLSDAALALVNLIRK